MPLSPQVVAILKALPRLGEFVFPGLKSGRPLSNMAMLSVLKDISPRTDPASLVGSIPRAVAQSLHTDYEPHLGRGEKTWGFPVISSKSCSAIRSGLWVSELIGVPTASIGAEP